MHAAVEAAERARAELDARMDETAARARADRRARKTAAETRAGGVGVVADHAPEQSKPAEPSAFALAAAALLKRGDGAS